MAWPSSLAGRDRQPEQPKQAKTSSGWIGIPQAGRAGRAERARQSSSEQREKRMIPIEQGEDHITGKSIAFQGPVITWVGEMPWTGGFAYGDEEGWLRYSSVDGPLKSNMPLKVIDSDRAINQVAFNIFREHKYIAACTASNIAIHRVGEGGQRIASKLVDVGGHGIYPTRWGGFLAPLGPGGLASFYPGADGKLDQHVLRHRNNFPYFYSMCRIGLTAEGKELWACAGRSGGLMAITLDEKGRLQVLRSFQSVKKPKDYVSVCGIGNEQMPHATVSISRDGQVDFSENLIEDNTPLAWHFPETQGVAYSLFAADGNLFILTSKGMYACIDIVKSFLDGKLRAGSSLSHVRYLSLEAIDFTLLYHRWLMILQHNMVVRLDVRELAMQGSSVTMRDSHAREISFDASASEPGWADITLGTFQLAVA